MFGGGGWWCGWGTVSGGGMRVMGAGVSGGHGGTVVVRVRSVWDVTVVERVMLVLGMV